MQRLNTMINFSLTTLSLSDAGKKYDGTYNETGLPDKSSNCHDPGLDKEVLVFAIFTVLFCILGILGNGIVIHLLGSSKRNTFTMYILNLSIADFGLVTAELIIEIHWFVTHLYCGFPYHSFQTVFLIMYSTGQFILTVISIDRCMSLFFPIWYRCRRPSHLPFILCIIIWVLSLILGGVHHILIVTTSLGDSNLMYQFIVNAVLCLPLMTVSSLTLLIKVYFVSNQQKRGKLLLAILLTLIFFLILAFPLNAFYFTIYIFHTIHPNLVHYGYLCACINSSINPLIYYIVGRVKMGRAKQSMKDILQRMFKEEEQSSEEMETTEGKI
ncbi:proto-oncogene Mas [Pogona vitticeps]